MNHFLPGIDAFRSRLLSRASRKASCPIVTMFWMRSCGGELYRFLYSSCFISSSSIIRLAEHSLTNSFLSQEMPVSYSSGARMTSKTSLAYVLASWPNRTGSCTVWRKLASNVQMPRSRPHMARGDQWFISI